jgi:hypothetical protein
MAAGTLGAAKDATARGAGAAVIGAASVGTAAVGAAAAVPVTGSAAAGSATIGTASVAPPATGPAAVGAAAVGPAAVGPAAMGSAVLGSATVGSAPAGLATGSVPAGGGQPMPAPGNAPSLDRANIDPAGRDSYHQSDADQSDADQSDADQSDNGLSDRGQNGRGQSGSRHGDGERETIAARASAQAVPLKSGGLRKPAAGETLAGLRGARTELRNQMRSRRRLRMVTLLSLAALVLLVLPAIFGLRAAGRDPIFSSLDSLDVPSWAAKKPDDQGSGSRWCFLDCRFRERVAQSDRPFKETTQAYTAALTAAGWHPWRVSECPEQPIEPADGTYSCWRRDEFTLDLWVRLPECAVDEIAAQDPSAVLPADGGTAAAPRKCVGSTVSIKVQNAITDTRGKADDSPGPHGELPDPVVTDDPLLAPTPKAS